MQDILIGAGLHFGLQIPAVGAFAAGLALALSSTAIVMQTMEEKRLTKLPVGRVAFSILLFQDIAAIPLLALVPVLGQPTATGQGGGGAVAVLQALAAVVAVIAIGRYLTRPVLRLIANRACATCSPRSRSCWCWASASSCTWPGCRWRSARSSRAVSHEAGVPARARVHLQA